MTLTWWGLVIPPPSPLTLRPSSQPLITMLIRHKPIPHNEPSVQISSSVVVKIRQGFVGQLFLFTTTLMCPKVISLYYVAFHAGCTDLQLVWFSQAHACEAAVRHLVNKILFPQAHCVLSIHRETHVLYSFNTGSILKHSSSFSFFIFLLIRSQLQNFGAQVL